MAAFFLLCGDVLQLGLAIGVPSGDRCCLDVGYAGCFLPGLPDVSPLRCPVLSRHLVDYASGPYWAAYLAFAVVDVACCSSAGIGDTAASSAVGHGGDSIHGGSALALC